MAKDNIDFDKFTFSELLELKTKLDDTITKKKEAERVELINKMADLAKGAGFSLSELFGTTTPASKKAPGDKRETVKPKYRNPNNHSETWAGRGREPKWVQDLLATGKTLEDLLIPS